MSKIFVWASSQKPSEEQLSSLKADGNVVFLKKEKPGLFTLLTNLEDYDDFYTLAKELILACSEIATKFNVDNSSVVLVQPGESLAFQFVLGMTIQHFKSKELWTPKIWYSHGRMIFVNRQISNNSVQQVEVFGHICWIQMSKPYTD